MAKSTISKTAANPRHYLGEIRPGVLFFGLGGEPNSTDTERVLLKTTGDADFVVLHTRDKNSPSNGYATTFDEGHTFELCPPGFQVTLTQEG